LFGEPRGSDWYFFTKDTPYPTYFGDKPVNYKELCDRNQYYADVAASIQSVLEEILVNLCKVAYKETGLENICLSGGVALNCTANWKIMQNTPFKNAYIQPAASDAGGALGAALYVYYTMPGGGKADSVRQPMNHASYGKSYTESEIKQFLDSQNIKYVYVPDENKLTDMVVDNIANGKVAGWFHGRFEWGPRALGNRSIIADARRHEMKDIVNVKIKFREPFRPFAPSVLVVRASEYFDIDNVESKYPARFMLYVVNVKEKMRDKVPAITHVDGTGRLQAVFKNVSPRYHGLIKKFESATGVPMVMNTSFNLKGEPIVNTPANAYSTFSRSGIDMLVLENFVVKKEDQNK
jgi:carbamoyltransferase